MLAAVVSSYLLPNQSSADLRQLLMVSGTSAAREFSGAGSSGHTDSITERMPSAAILPTQSIAPVIPPHTQSAPSTMPPQTSPRMPPSS
jgi:hypothetical protein